MSEHTSGTWEVAGVTTLDPHGVYSVDENGKRLRICSVRHGSLEINRAESAANARLIAAAPDLLKACELMKKATECNEVDYALAMIDDAVAKAKGKL